jgi:hypothetical protein
LAQPYALQVSAVGYKGLLCIGAAFDKIKKCLRHPAASRLPQVLDAGRYFHGMDGC